MNTIQKGEFACLKFEEEAIKRGVIVSRPSVESRYDRIADVDGRLYRVQVKYSDHRDHCGSSNDVISIRTSTVIKPKSSHGNSHYVSRCYNKSEIDAIVAYVPKIDRLLWINVEVFDGKFIMNVRFGPTRNGQKSGCHFVEEFLW